MVITVVPHCTNTLSGSAMIVPESSFRCVFTLESLAQPIDDKANAIIGQQDQFIQRRLLTFSNLLIICRNDKKKPI
jgi:hypothetical protein